MSTPTDEQLLNTINALEDLVIVRRGHYKALRKINGKLNKWEIESEKQTDDIEVVTKWLLSQVTCDIELG